MSETHSDYGRDENGCYKGNVQAHPPHQLGGETQATICDWAIEHEIRTGRNPMGDGTLGSSRADTMIWWTIKSGMEGIVLADEVNRRMAQLRYPPRQVPVEPNPEWQADADAFDAARKGAGGAA